MPRSEDFRKTKPQYCLTNKGRGGWRSDTPFELSADSKAELIKISDDPEFINEIGLIIRQFLDRDPVIPETTNGDNFESLKKINEAQKKKRALVQPTLADVKKTLQLIGSEKKIDKVTALSALPVGNPVWISLNRVCKIMYKKSLVELGVDWEVIKRLSRKNNERLTTPIDHPSYEDVQNQWAGEFSETFNRLNYETIPGLITLAIENLPKVYFPTLLNGANEKRWLAWNLAKLFVKFGINPSQSKDGKLNSCLEVCLLASGHKIRQAHKYITSEIIKDAKKNLNKRPPLGEEVH